MSEPGHSEFVALRRQIVSLEEKNGRLSASLATARDRIKELNDQLETLSRRRRPSPSSWRPTGETIRSTPSSGGGR